jgi:hypothetical protein
MPRELRRVYAIRLSGSERALIERALTMRRAPVRGARRGDPPTAAVFVREAALLVAELVTGVEVGYRREQLFHLVRAVVREQLLEASRRSV